MSGLRSPISTAMTANQDPTVYRKRRTVEVAAFVARGLGLATTLAFLLHALGPMSADLLPALQAACVAGIALMAVGNALAVINFRRPWGRRFHVLNAVQVAIDTATVTGIVIWAQGYNQQTAWPVLIIAIVVAAYRLRLAGALTVWAITSAAFAAAMHAIAHPTLRDGEVASAVILGLIIAILCGIQGNAFDQQVKQLNKARAALQHQAHHDPLTGLPNRDQLAEYAAARHGRPLAVLLLDLDGFKLVNDTYGHATGDRLLQEVARRLDVGLRDGDLAGRIGGDEFVVLMPGADRHTADEVAGRLRTEIRRPMAIDGRSVTVGVSIGVAAGSDPFEDLSREADAAMYRDKATSRR
jgi:diguanylate cyclase (GGDEF)-like protein